MSIQWDHKGYVVEDELNEEEARVFIAFLLQESQRHGDDIDFIMKTVNKLADRFNIDVADL